MNVLVVDDDVAVCDAVAEVLTRTGARVRLAESADQAMAVMQEFKPEVLLCDIAMPGEDGYSLLRRVRALGPLRGGNVPALALTALAGEADRQRAFAAGFQAHLAKPVDIDRLTRAVVELARGLPLPIGSTRASTASLA